MQTESENINSHYSKCDPVSIVPMGEYGIAEAKEALIKVLEPIGSLDFVRSGMRVVIKANLVSAMKPEEAATTHPTLICALVELLVERGATVVVGDSPGGLYNASFVGRVYNASGMRAVTEHGGELNQDFSERDTEYPEGKVLHSFRYTGYLDNADLIINFCKLKSHGMMGMSCAAKNMFGTVPGVIKPEYHFRFPKYEDFADMLLDLDEYFHPVLSIADAVVGMEGNGPTAGTPRKIGCLIASHSPHTLDMVASRLIGLDESSVPTLDAAKRRGLLPDTLDEITIYGNIVDFILSDFCHVVERHSLQFAGDGKSLIKRMFGGIVGRVFRTKPRLVRKMCVGCGICRDICPASAIVIKNKKAKINRKSCIRCFCCQEFCPKSAMKVGRTLIASIFHREKKK